MIKGADRKEDTKVIQFRAASRYSNMADLIAEAINERFKVIGSSDKFTTTDVMKLAIESLCFGKSEIDILGRKVKINQLVVSHLKKYYKDFDISKYRVILDKLFTRVVITKIKQIEDVMFERMIDTKNKEDEEFTHERMMLEAETSLLSCDGWEDSNAFKLEDRELEHVNYYLDIVKAEHCGVKIGFEQYEYDKMRTEMEEAILENEDFKYIYALKLFDNYRFSQILAEIRNQIEIRIEYIKDYLTETIIDDPFAPKESETEDYDDIDEYFNDDDYYADHETYRKPYDYDDDDSEFSEEEGYDNWYDK